MIDFIVSLLGSKRTARQVAAKRIRKCFDGCKWESHTFVCNGITMKGGGDGGGTKFYNKSEVDLAIDRLNKVLADLSR